MTEHLVHDNGLIKRDVSDISYIRRHFRDQRSYGESDLSSSLSSRSNFERINLSCSKGLADNPSDITATDGIFVPHNASSRAQSALKQKKTASNSFSGREEDCEDGIQGTVDIYSIAMSGLSEGGKDTDIAPMEMTSPYQCVFEKATPDPGFDDFEFSSSRGQPFNAIRNASFAEEEQEDRQLGGDRQGDEEDEEKEYNRYHHQHQQRQVQITCAEKDMKSADVASPRTECTLIDSGIDLSSGSARENRDSVVSGEDHIDGDVGIALLSAGALGSSMGCYEGSEARLLGETENQEKGETENQEKGETKNQEKGETENQEKAFGQNRSSLVAGSDVCKDKGKKSVPGFLHRTHRKSPTHSLSHPLTRPLTHPASSHSFIFEPIQTI